MEASKISKPEDKRKRKQIDRELESNKGEKQSVLTCSIRLLRMIPFDVFLNQDKTKIK